MLQVYNFNTVFTPGMLHEPLQAALSLQDLQTTLAQDNPFPALFFLSRGMTRQGAQSAKELPLLLEMKTV